MRLSGTQVGVPRIDVPSTTLVADLRARSLTTACAPSRSSSPLYGHDASIVEGGDGGGRLLPARRPRRCRRACGSARAHGRPFTARGAGTGLAGGAVPLGGPVVIVTTKMNRILSIDADERVAWVEPGVINLDLTRALAAHGLHFAPDPSSQQACSIGGNVANNSGGPHCLAYGVTSAHVLADRGRAARRRGRRARWSRRRARPATTSGACSSGAKGRWGSPPGSRYASRPTRRRVRTLLVDFASDRRCRRMRERDHRRGLVPAALEMMAGGMIDAVEAFVARRLSRPMRPPCCSSRSTAAGVRRRRRRAVIRAISRAERRPHGPGRGRRGRAAAAVEGAQVGLRRGRPHRARLLPARHRRAPHAAGRGAAPRSTRIAAAVRACGC